MQRAAFMYEMALAFNTGCAEAHNNLGVIWKEQVGVREWGARVCLCAIVTRLTWAWGWSEGLLPCPHGMSA